ncbi:MAG: MT-A70 family methyltransferase [Dehalococcoidia bacterium]|nr:MT-A70 family methyltransferase [Dehalococcoidia bacterium]
MRTHLVAPSSLHSHPAASLIPDMRPDEWAEFYRDVAFRGIKVPLEILADGTVLDGRHRLKAALELTLPTVPVVDAVLGNLSPERYMLKAAYLRRHLTDGQRAAMSVLDADEHKEKPGPKSGVAAQRRAATDRHEGVTRAEAIREARITRRQYDTANKLRHGAPELFDKVHRGELDLRMASRKATTDATRERLGNLPLVDGQFLTLVADPPWPFDNTGSRGAAADHYPSLSIEAIAALEVADRPVKDLAPEEAGHLYLWTPSSFLAEGIAARIARAWGFEPKCVLTWVKPQVGVGNWFRGASEHVLFCVRGNLPLATREALSTWFMADRQEHSQKPDEFYHLVERASPGPRLELFARRHREGWEAWGDELT